MKSFKAQLTALVLSLLALNTFALGPRIQYHWITWKPSPSAGVTGYWLYYRTSTNAYSDANRFAASTNLTLLSGTNVLALDLFTLPLPPTNYTFAMSATNLVGDESPLSNEATWNSAYPEKPVITSITK